MKQYRFYKEEDGRWFIDLPEWEGDKAELQMVCGANDMLDIIAGEMSDVTLTIGEEKFDESEELVLTNLDEDNGGAWYVMSEFEGKKYSLQMWLCPVTEFVFGGYPEILHIRRYKKNI
jgi:hypothetical protein